MVRRPISLLVSMLAVGTFGFQPARAATPFAAPAHRMSPMLELGAQYGHAFHLDPAPAGQTPEQRLQWLVNERPALGRTPAGWTAIARGFTDLAAPAARVGAPADLATEVVALDRIAGATVRPADVTAITQAAAALPASIRQPFATLVQTVRAAYTAQVPVAAAVNARLTKNFDLTTPLLTAVERDAMVARQQAIVAAVGAFRAAVAGHVGEFRSTGRSFADPAGLVLLGSSGSDTYNRGAAPLPDPILVVDPDGADTYNTSAGGACPVAPEGALPPPFLVGGRMMDCNGLVLAVTADLGSSSNDSYSYFGPPAAFQGAAGPGAIGVLVDAGGDDSYLTEMTRGDVPTFPTTYWDGGSQGFGYGGVGLLLDLVGNDRYDSRVFSAFGYDSASLAQGFGGGGGVGLAVDAGGSDQWLAEGLGQIGNRGFQGIYNNGTGLFGGVGLLEEIGGDDHYYSSVTSTTTDYYAQGFGGFGGLGILDEVAGSDSYFTQEVATDPFFGPQLNCAYGTASFAGVGIMIDHMGNDYYEGDTNSPSGAHVMDWGWGGPGAAFGAFADFGGDDVYNEHAESTGEIYHGGFGYYEPTVPDLNDPGFFDDIVNSPGGSNVFGVFVDIGGTDAYTSPHDEEVKNDSVWAFGVDHA